MRILVDTHTFIWAVSDPKRLSHKAKVLLEDPDNDAVLSVASIWEMAIKTSLGRLTIASSLADLLRDQISHRQFSVLSISAEHAIGVVSLPMYHTDPFDRLLVSQCKIEQIPLVSRDSELDAYGIERAW